MRFRFVVVGLLGLAALQACPPSGQCAVDADCKTGSACCGGACLDVTNDKDNCGGCGVQCALPNAVPTCRSGRCQLQCETGFGNCNGSKDDGCEEVLASSSVACGRCGNVCTLQHATPACVSSKCQVMSCNGTFADCDSDPDTGCEVNTQTDLLHCGGCGTPCTIANGSGACDAGTCQVGGCDAGFDDCDGNPVTGCETELASANEHCGVCGKVCDPQQSCVQSRCWANQLLVVGGLANLSGAPPTRDVWRFDLGTGAFTLLAPSTPGGLPPVRSHHVAAWDRERDRLLVWGGIDGTGSAVAGDVWALEFASEPPVWRRVTTQGTAPASRASPAFAVDDEGGHLWVFGGTTDTGAGKSDLARYDFATDTWTVLHADGAAGAPSNRINSMGAFEPVLKRFVVMGGTLPGNGVDYAELWEWDVAQGAWRTPRTGGVVARGLGALFGGPPLSLFSGVSGLLATPSTILGFDSLDLSGTASWQSLAPGAAAPRFNAAHAEHDGRLYVFGGGATGGTGITLSTDLWRYDTAAQQWTRLHDGTGTAPAGVFAARMVYR